MNFGLYGLLHLDDREKTSVNLYTRNFQEQVKVYVNNAITLYTSLEKRGIELTLLTNRKSLIEQVLHSKRKVMRVVEIPFITKVPSGVKFYSAHFKLDAYRYLAQQSEYVGLCDLDMVCINNIPQSLVNNVKNRIPMCYDISDQVIPAYGQDVIIRDLESILGIESEGRWSGGEFISGSPEFFFTLVKEIDNIYEKYINNIETLHHISDEPTTSAALEKMRKNGQWIADVGTLGIVGRYWNAKVLHPQKPFEYFKQCFLLHLPADKIFLSEMASKELKNQGDFIKNYLIYKNSKLLNPKSFLRRIKRKFMP